MEKCVDLRNIRPDDYKLIISVLDQWWEGRRMSDMLPKLFFVHFCQTSFIAEVDYKIVGFLSGFLSQTYSEEAYIHFVGVHPDFRKQGIGRALYQQFFQTVQESGCMQVKCVTSPINKSSIAYHLRLGFEAEPSAIQEDGIPYHREYDGVGEDRVLFVKRL